MPWLAMISLFCSYLSHFKSDFDCVKCKVGFFNSYNLCSYLSSQQLVSQNAVASYNTFGHLSIIQILLEWKICSVGTKIPNQIYWTISNKPKLQNWIYKIESTKQNVWNVKNQMYQPNLFNQTYKTKSTQPILLSLMQRNQIYR